MIGIRNGRRRAWPAALLLAALAGPATAQTSQPARIVRLDKSFDALVAPDARLERVVAGFDWLEGPVWDGGGLLFSDVERNAVYRWEPGVGVSDYLRPSGYTGTTPFTGREPGSNGLLLHPALGLVLCQHGDRRLARLSAEGVLTTLADRFEGRRLNSPNDVTRDARGDLLFTDPPFGLPGTFEDPERELPFSGVYRLSPDGRLTLLTVALTAPNGVALAPSGTILYVTNADRDRPVLVALEVRVDGSVGESRVLFDATPWLRPDRGVPDGIEVDERGNLWVAGPAGIHVLAPDGTPLGILDPGATTSNAAWGEDGSVLYITADDSIWRIRTRVRGAGIHVEGG